MELKRAFKSLRAPSRELDRERLREFCSSRNGCTPIKEASPRQEVTVVGEITCVSIVPKVEGSPWLEATISDGTGSLVAMWTGRRKIAGIKPGQRLVIRGRGCSRGPGQRLLIYNPHYELLA